MNTNNLMAALALCCLCLSCSESPLPEYITPTFPSDSEGPSSPVPSDKVKAVSIRLNDMPAFGLAEFSPKDGDEMAVWAVDSVQKAYRLSSSVWSSSSPALISHDTQIRCIYPRPLGQDTDVRETVIIDATRQKDVLYGECLVSLEKAEADITLSHMMSKLSLTFKKKEYVHEGKVTSVSVTSAEKGVFSWDGKRLAATGSITLRRDVLMSLDDGSYIEFLILPEEGRDISISAVIDSETYSWVLSSGVSMGKCRMLELSVTDQNLPSEVIHTEVNWDESYWAGYGKDDDMPLGKAIFGKDMLFLQGARGEGGHILYRNRPYNYPWAIILNPYQIDWDGDIRMCLVDDKDNIIEKYPAQRLALSDGKTYSKIYCRVLPSAPEGEYRLIPYLRNKGEREWYRPYATNYGFSMSGRYMTDYFPHELFGVIIRKESSNPVIRYLGLNGSWAIDHFCRIYTIKAGVEFDLSYVLYNRERKSLRGRIKAVWERSFNWEGNMYTSSDKFYDDENEWSDVLAIQDIRMTESDVFKEQMMRVSLPRVMDNDGHCTPMIRLYYQQEGSSSWEMLDTDFTPAYTKWKYPFQPWKVTHDDHLVGGFVCIKAL